MALRKSAIKIRLQHLAKTYLSPKSEVRPLLAETDESKWHSGGIAYKDWVVTVAVSSSPVAAMPSQLINVIEKRKVHQRYFLSANAAQGILRRVDKLGRHLYPSLDSVLRSIVAISAAPKKESSQTQESRRVEKLVAV